MRLKAALLLCTLPPLLGGCVAVAIPVLAGAAVAKKQVDGPDKAKTPAPPAEQRVAVFVGEEKPTANLAPTAVTRAEPVPAAQPAPRLYTVVDQPTAPAVRTESTSVTKGIAPAPVTLPASSLDGMRQPVVKPAPAPEPVPLKPDPVWADTPKPQVIKIAKSKSLRTMLPTPAPLPLEGETADGYMALTAYALSRASSPESTGVLDVIDASDPLSEPRRSQCGGLPPAVMIDLDPELDVFDPARTTAQPGLSSALAALRAAGVTVMWISALPIEKAEVVHNALAKAGLDNDRTDRLLLLNGAGDRKQARRLSAGRNWCVIAMAGDRRGDFDEAFDYLKDADTIIPADRMFGKGWFIAPAPIP